MGRPGPTSLAFSTRNSPSGVRTVVLSLPARSPRALITREVISKAPPRRMQKPQVMAIIMKRSDLEEEAPPEAELDVAIACFSPSVHERAKSPDHFTEDGPGDAALSPLLATFLIPPKERGPGTRGRAVCSSRLQTTGSAEEAA